MIRLYEKSELLFSAVWIGLYVFLSGAADGVSAWVRDGGTFKALAYAVFAAALAAFVTKNGLREKYGLCRAKVNWRKYLYFLPLAAIASANLWAGVRVPAFGFETLGAVIGMLCVGVIEEIIFRGFLFRALAHKSEMRAAVISSLVFGALHLYNLLNGGQPMAVFAQICFASSLGFLFAVIFSSSQSLAPCVIAHAAINVLSVFAKQTTPGYDMALAAVLTGVSLLYAFRLLNGAREEKKTIDEYHDF